MKHLLDKRNKENNNPPKISKMKLLHHYIPIQAFLIALAVFTSSSVVQSQQTKIQQSGADSLGKLSFADSSTIIEEKLVELALNGPFYKGAEHQNKINEYQLKGAKNSWLNLLTISTNYNDQSFASDNQTAAYIYPKYFFGVTIPLGTLFSRTEIKAAREGIEISKNNQEQLARNIRAEVISKYRQYKNYFALISLQSQAVDDEETAFLQVKEKFRNGAITIELHNIAQKKYNDELTKKLNLQLQQDMIKIDIERLIGTSLENVLKQ